MYEYKITVFTPAYNRGYIIRNLYDSLKRQTFRNFEWVVIDDGSADNTKELFDEWTKEENFFFIRYMRVSNGGKHRAINRAADIAKGELFFIVDSDDYLTDTSLERIKHWSETIGDDKSFAGISGNKGKSQNNIIGETFKGVYVDASQTQREKYNIIGDKAEAYFTDILKKYKFPEFEGENFVTERVLWDKIGHDGYKIRWFNEIIYIADYLDDGLSHSGDAIFRKNPRGTAYNLTQMAAIYNYNLRDRISCYNAFYHLVKDDITVKEAAEYLDIQILTLKLSILAVKFKNIIGRKAGQ